MKCSSTYSYDGDAYGPSDTQSSRAYNLLKQDYEMAMQKLNSTMSSIKTFWSPELKRERQLRKEETAKLAALQRQVCKVLLLYATLFDIFIHCYYFVYLHQLMLLFSFTHSWHDFLGWTSKRVWISSYRVGNRT